jgi:hypothetical protein
MRPQAGLLIMAAWRSYGRAGGGKARQEIPVGPLKRVGTWLVYIVGALAIGYLGLYAYAMFTQPKLVPGEPIQIFRRPDAPNYS